MEQQVKGRSQQRDVYLEYVVALVLLRLQILEMEHLDVLGGNFNLDNVQLLET